MYTEITYKNILEFQQTMAKSQNSIDYYKFITTNKNNTLPILHKNIIKYTLDKYVDKKYIGMSYDDIDNFTVDSIPENCEDDKANVKLIFGMMIKSIYDNKKAEKFSMDVINENAISDFILVDLLMNKYKESFMKDSLNCLDKYEIDEINTGKKLYNKLVVILFGLLDDHYSPQNEALDQIMMYMEQIYGGFNVLFNYKSPNDDDNDDNDDNDDDNNNNDSDSDATESDTSDDDSDDDYDDNNNNNNVDNKRKSSTQLKYSNNKKSKFE